MKRYLKIFFALISVVTATPLLSTSGVSDETKDQIVDSFKSIQTKNFSVKESLQNYKFSGNKIYYALGERSKDDRILAEQTDTLLFGEKQDFKLFLNYPLSGRGGIVQYLEFTAEQSSTEGDIQVVEGGFGQRHIAFVFEAKQTYYFRYHVAVYGRN